MSRSAEARTFTGRGLLAFVVFALALLVVGCEPSVPSDALGGVSRLSGGAEMSCAHSSDHKTWCWGESSLTNQISDTKYAKRTIIDHVAFGARSDLQTCAILDDRTVACGRSDFGLFDATWENPPELEVQAKGPYQEARGLSIVPGLSNIAQLALGSYLNCARRIDGVVLCWGDYAEVLRTGKWDRTRRSGASVPNASTVAEVKGLPPISDLSVGDDSALAIGADGTAWTLGGLDRGVKQVPLIADATNAASGAGFHCVLRHSGVVACFRDGFAIHALAKLEFGKVESVNGLGHAIRISAGRYNACALLETGSVSCWGNYDAAFDKESSSWLEPSPVPHTKNVRELQVGWFHACGLLEDGHVFCWGDSARIGMGYDAYENHGKPPHGEAFVRTGAADDAGAVGRRKGMGAALLSALAFVLMLVYAARVDRRAQWPGATVSGGAGYRAPGDLASANVRPPGIVRLATWLGLGAVGADAIVVVLFLMYSLVAGALGWRQLGRDNVSAVINLTMTLLFVVPLAWLISVGWSIVRGARGDARRLKQWRGLGILHFLSHGALGLTTFVMRRELGMLLGLHGWESTGGGEAWLALALYAASALGVVASVVMVLAQGKGKLLKAPIS